MCEQHFKSPTLHLPSVRSQRLDLRSQGYTLGKVLAFIDCYSLLSWWLSIELNSKFGPGLL